MKANSNVFTLFPTIHDFEKEFRRKIKENPTMKTLEEWKDLALQRKEAELQMKEQEPLRKELNSERYEQDRNRKYPTGITPMEYEQMKTKHYNNQWPQLFPQHM